MTLNRYGLLALDFCRRHRPSAWASLPGPVSTFETIGNEIQAEVTRLRDQLLEQCPATEDLLELDRRAAQALSTAEDLVITEHSAFQPEPPTEAEPDPDLGRSWQTLAAVNDAIHHRPQ